MTKRTLDARNIPHAHHFDIGRCADNTCRRPHLIAFDANDKPILIIDWPIEDPRYIEMLQSLIYAATAVQHE